MEFSYQFDESTWLAFNEHNLRYSPIHRRTRFWSRFVIIPIALVFIVHDYFAKDEVVGLTITFSVIAVFWFFLYPKVYNNSVMKKVKKIVRDEKNRSRFEKQTFEITPEHIHWFSAGGESTVNWDKIVSVTETDDYIFIYISTVEAIIIPHKSLEGASFEDVKSKVNEYFGKRTANS